MRWGPYLRWLLFGAAALCGALAAALVVIDPYDTGRGPLSRWPGIPRALGARLADASRGRDPIFNSAIFGNSTSELLMPGRLDRLIGERFVNLMVTGTGPYEQIVVLDWFLRHHRGGVKAIVLGMDRNWCDHAPAFTAAATPNPFPFWLYGAEPANYLSGLFSFRSIEDSVRRLGVVIGRAPAARRDGYNDFEATRTYDAAAAAKRMPRRGPDDEGGAENAATKAAATPSAFDEQRFLRLGALLRDLPATARIAVLFVPRYAETIPPAGSPAAAAIAFCKDRARALAAADPRVRIVDFLRDDPVTRNAENFWDAIHYRGTVARLIEDRLAVAFASPSPESDMAP